MKRIDDLQLNGLQLIQDTNLFCFGTDAVLLSNFVAECNGITSSTRIIDFGCGNGIIPILLSAKTPSECITGIEIQAQSAELATENVKLNNLIDKITILNQCLTSCTLIADIICCNPPYKKSGTGIENPDSPLAIARHEIKCTLESIIQSASRSLSHGGKFCLIHRPERLAEIFHLLRLHSLEPKRLQMVHFSIKHPPTLVLIEASKNGKPFLKCQSPIIISN